MDLTHPGASGKNPGTRTLPFKTINQAVAVALANNINSVATKIAIKAGTYRESISMPMNGHETSAAIIFEAEGQVIISGSDIWKGWQRQDNNSYTHSWPYKWGLAAIPAGWEPQVTVRNIVRRREMVFVNGAPLDQVLSYSQMKAGSFCVDENAAQIYITPPDGTNMETAVVEVAVRAPLFRASGKTNLVLRGIIFQHDNSPVDDRAVLISNSSNILVEDCRFRLNNWHGLGFNRSRNLIVRRNLANRNGGAGMTTWKTNKVVFEDNETSYNNRRGVKGEFTGWTVAGMKNLRLHGGIFLKHKSLQNNAHGMWFDTDCEHIIVNKAVIGDNLRMGLYLEANQGPINLQNSIICHNREYGVLIANSAEVTLDGNVIYGNAKTQIMVSGLYEASRREKNWETQMEMALLARNGTWLHNAIVGTDASQLLVGTTLSFALWNHFVDSLTSNRNLWFNAQNINVFQLPGGTQVNFRTWRLMNGQDYTSRFADPCFKDPANGDFNPFPDSPFLQIPGTRSP